MQKRVTFSSSAPIMHVTYVWQYAYRESRKSVWIICAIDRMRFQRRIKQTEIILIKHLEQRLKIQQSNINTLCDRNPET